MSLHAASVSVWKCADAGANTTEDQAMNRTFRHPDTGADMPDQRRSEALTLTYKWLVPVLLSILLLGGGGWVSSIHAQVASQSDRLARVETAVLRLPRIEDKLDRLLELR